MEPYYQDEYTTIYCGDAREILPTLADDSADIVLTDPPFGVGKRERTYAKITGPAAEWDDEFPTWWFEDAARIAPVLGLMPGIVNLPRCPLSMGRLVYKWTLAGHLVNGMARGAIGYGNWIPCMVYAADGVSVYKQASDVGRIVVGRGTKPNHPSPKPIEYMRWLVDRLPGERILDPFVGSGTTLVAAKERGRRAVGIDSSEAHCETAAERVRNTPIPLVAVA
jgi:DNA modification methylase